MMRNSRAIARAAHQQHQGTRAGKAICQCSLHGLCKDTTSFPFRQTIHDK